MFVEPLLLGLFMVQRLGRDRHSLAMKSDGTLWLWGESDSGQLGDPTPVDRLTPAQFSESRDWHVSAGGSHSMALKRDGNLWIWGSNFRGQLGVGAEVQVGSDADWGAPQ